MKKLIYILPILVLLLNACDNNTPAYLYRINVNGQYGFIDSLGRVSIEPKYLYASDFKEGLALVIVDPSSKDMNNPDTHILKYGFIDLNGKLVIDTMLELRLDSLENANRDWNIKPLLFSEGLAVFQSSSTGKYGYIDSHGNEIIAPTYTNAAQFSEGLASVNIAEKNTVERRGYINKAGVLVIDTKYSMAKDFSEGLASVCISNLAELVPEIEKIELNESIVVTPSFTWLVINTSGNMVNGPFDGSSHRLYSYADGYCPVEFHQWGPSIGWNFIDKKGNYLFPDGYINDVTRFADGFAGGQQNDGKWVFMDKFGKVRSRLFDEVKPFSDGLASVKENGKWGVVDTSFNLVIPCKYDDCGLFYRGLATFTINHNSLVIDGYFDKDGRIVWQTEHHDIHKAIN